MEDTQTWVERRQEHIFRTLDCRCNLPKDAATNPPSHYDECPVLVCYNRQRPQETD